jgi:anti-sigma28 factor (negative regulator of flagellin synthesis)
MGISPLGDNLAPSTDVRSSQDVRSGQVEQAQQEQVQRQERTQQSEHGSDSVSLSSLGAELARSLNSESPEQVRRLDELQQAVNNGTLQASSHETASRLVEEALSGEARAGVESPPSPV